MNKFVISKTNSGFQFELKTSSGEIVATSEVYTSLESCKDGIESVKVNAPQAPVEDQTKDGFKLLSNPKYEVYTDKAGDFRFRLKAANGAIVIVGENYKSLAGVLNGIKSIEKNVASAEIVEE